MLHIVSTCSQCNYRQGVKVPTNRGPGPTKDSVEPVPTNNPVPIHPPKAINCMCRLFRPLCVCPYLPCSLLAVSCVSTSVFRFPILERLSRSTSSRELLVDLNILTGAVVINANGFEMLLRACSNESSAWL